MKKHLSCLLLLILTLSLLLSSCTYIPLPPELGGGGIEDIFPDTEGGNEGNETENGGEVTDPITPPEIVLPTLPEADTGDFGEYTSYYRFETVGDAFTLYTYQINEKGEFRSIPLTGTYTEEEGNYTLDYTTGERGYGKYYHGTFTLTDESFVSLEEMDTRGGDGVTKVEITPSEGGTDFGYRDLAYNKNGEGMQAFYRDILAACRTFQGSTENVPRPADYYKICELNFAKHGISAEEAQSVWSLFRSENPVYYWLSSVCYYTPTTFYLTIDVEYSLGAHRAEYAKDISDMLAEAMKYISSATSDLERAVLLHRFLVLRIDYAYIEGTTTPETASWAHNILGAARVGTGVCETYAKTYQFLCQSAGIPTLFVTGYAGEPHAWNLIYLEGEWVGVDATWDDMNGQYFLNSHFGLSASALAKDHEQDAVGGTGTLYHYKTPIVSPFGLSLCVLYDDQGNSTLCKNLDSALAKMTDKSRDYTIKYFNYTEHGAYTVEAPDITYYISDSTLPECRSLFLGGAYYTQTNAETVVYLSAMDFTLNIPLTLENTTLEASHPTHRGITATDSPLTAQGTLTLNIRGELSEVSVDGKLYLGASVDIHSLTASTVYTTNADATVLLRSLSYPDKVNFALRHQAGTLYLGELPTIDRTLDTLLVYQQDGASLHLLSHTEGSVLLALMDGENAHLSAKDFLTLSEHAKNINITVATLNSHNAAVVRNDFFTMDEEYHFVRKVLSTTSDKMIYSGDTLLAYYGESPTLVLPEGVTKIGASAFADCSLNLLVLPEGVTHILGCAFSGSALRTVTLPLSLIYFDGNIPNNYVTPSSVTTYNYSGTYTEWARMVANMGGFTLRFLSQPTVQCTDGKGILTCYIPHDEAKPYRAVSDSLTSITSTSGLRGKRMHYIEYDAEGNANLYTYDIYSNAGYGTPEKLASLTLSATGDGSFSFQYKGQTYYIEVENGVLRYTDASGSAVTSYPK